MVAKNKQEVKVNNNFLSILGIISFIIVIALVIFFINFLNNGVNSGAGNVINDLTDHKDCREVQVPYEEQENYFERVPYTDKECDNVNLQYNVVKGNCINRVDRFFSSDEMAKYSCKINNLDSEGGTFSMRIGFNVNNQQLEETQNKYIYSQSSENFMIARDTNIDSCYCYEIVPTKQICRDVIKYQDVSRTRIVTKYRIENKCD